MGINMLFYIIFGTNLLTEGPVPVSVFIIYLLEDEQELSLGMLDTSPTYL